MKRYILLAAIPMLTILPISANSTDFFQQSQENSQRLQQQLQDQQAEMRQENFARLQQQRQELHDEMMQQQQQRWQEQHGQ